ncbi:hypothetical protein PYCCODRAFT_1454573 [Trametes coccinea BRFM310]|uniref:Uncharacterized protein n=1 Tax=Trametes coccinea (strain BRFM310) TaxID=1353009 RepID=A0A1Y2IAE9_TRAC3|nr:hypothetical protein PYCCODRAFT_1454573 [Trametes coccinea BRFM310]
MPLVGLTAIARLAPHASHDTRRCPPLLRDTHLTHRPPRQIHAHARTHFLLSSLWVRAFSSLWHTHSFAFALRPVFRPPVILPACPFFVTSVRRCGRCGYGRRASVGRAHCMCCLAFVHTSIPPPPPSVPGCVLLNLFLTVVTILYPL